MFHKFAKKIKKKENKIRRNIYRIGTGVLLPFRDVILIHLPECTPDVTKSSTSFYLATENCALIAIPTLLAAHTHTHIHSHTQTHTHIQQN